MDNTTTTPRPEARRPTTENDSDMYDLDGYDFPVSPAEEARRLTRVHGFDRRHPDGPPLEAIRDELREAAKKHEYDLVHSRDVSEKRRARVELKFIGMVLDEVEGDEGAW